MTTPVFIQPGQEVTAKFTSQLWVVFRAAKWWLAKSRQKKLICKDSSDEVALSAAIVRTLTMVHVIWIPLRRAKWPPIVRAQHTESPLKAARVIMI